jgi:GMP synthase (glutamine-hydrolysing)
MKKKILIVDCGSSKVPEIEKMLAELSAETRKIKLDSLPDEDLDAYNGIVISGAPVLLTKEKKEPFLEKIKALKKYENPVLGICFGHQLIGLLHGAEISLCREDRDWQDIQKLKESALLIGFGNNFRMKEDHIECISLPENFELIASSSTCENEAMQHKLLPVYGVQFHPETSMEEGKKIFSNFLWVCKK